jgi:hypothetical protein
LSGRVFIAGGLVYLGAAAFGLIWLTGVSEDIASFFQGGILLSVIGAMLMLWHWRAGWLAAEATAMVAAEATVPVRPVGAGEVVAGGQVNAGSGGVRRQAFVAQCKLTACRAAH